jgi:beta-lactam-binding protein with PASTA domain
VVISQSIPPKTKLQPDSNTLQLVVQKSYAVVPRLIGMDFLEAARRLGQESLFIEMHHRPFNSTTPQPGENQVMQASPQPDSLVARGQVVRVMVFTRIPCTPIGGCIPIRAVIARSDSAALRANREAIAARKP